MKRDMDLIRQILFAAEAGPPYSAISGYTPEAIRYHQMLAIDAGLLKGKYLSYYEDTSDVPSSVVVQGVEWAGHDFLAATRDDTNWNKLKNYLTETGKAVTLETLIAGARVLFGVAP